MLNHRTNVLFSSQEYALYSRIAKQKNISLSQLVRESLSLAYQPRTRKDIVASIQKNWKLLKNPEQKMEYRKLIEEGRKY